MAAGVREILALLRQHGTLNSEQIADQLGTVQTHVSGKITTLRRQGYVEHVSGHGYRLVKQGDDS